MMNGTASTADRYLLGAILTVAIVAGGGSAPGLAVDSMLELALILASAVVIWRHVASPVDRRVLVLSAAVVAMVALQLVPLPASLIDPLQPIVLGIDPALVARPGFRPISLNVGRTLEAMAWAMTCVMLTVAIAKLRFEDAYGLIPFFLVGTLCHLIAGLIQYSAAGPQTRESIFGFPLAAGFFANANHFSTLIAISIPLAFAYFHERRRLSLSFAYLAGALLVLLAVGSRAGVATGLAATLLGAAILLRRGTVPMLSFLSGAALVGIYAIGLWARFSAEGLEETLRGEIARTTLRGVLDNPVTGVGFGGFVTAYPSYEATESITNVYVNHAHNDFLELIFEGGIPAAILLAAFLLVFSGRVIATAHRSVHYACALSILFLLVHSMLDYPLRTMAVSVSFCMMAAILFHRGADMPRQTQGGPKGRVRPEGVSAASGPRSIAGGGPDTPRRREAASGRRGR